MTVTVKWMDAHVSHRCSNSRLEEENGIFRGIQVPAPRLDVEINASAEP